MTDLARIKTVIENLRYNADAQEQMATPRDQARHLRLTHVSQMRGWADSLERALAEEPVCQCWNEGQYGRVHREDCPIHSEEAVGD